MQPEAFRIGGAPASAESKKLRDEVVRAKAVAAKAKKEQEALASHLKESQEKCSELENTASSLQASMPNQQMTHRPKPLSNV